MVQNVPPPSSHVIVLPQEFAITGRHQIEFPGGRLVMNKPRQWRPHDEITAFTKPQTQIHIIECDRQVRTIESTDLKKYVSPHNNASGGHRRNILLQQCPTEIARIVGRDVAVKMSRDPGYAEDDAGVLYAPIGIKEFRPNGANFWSASICNHVSQPAGLDRL